MYLNSYAAKTIAQMDVTINPYGVEGHMRNIHNTLSHLPLEAFFFAIVEARQIEAIEPGYLRECADDQGMVEEYDHWQKKSPYNIQAA